MKALKHPALALLIVSTLFVACKKDSNNNTPVEPNGTPGEFSAGVWQGKYGFGTETPNVTYIFNIKAGGVIEELNSQGNSKGDGTWALNGTSFTATYQWKAPYFTKFKVAATYDKNTGKLTGTWGYDASATDGGKWNMIKKN